MAEAAARRLPSLELRGEWLAQSTRHKLGTAARDPELVSIAQAQPESVGEAAQVLLTEAYVAWDDRNAEATARLAHAARVRFRSLATGAGVSITTGLLALANGDVKRARSIVDPRFPFAALDLLQFVRQHDDFRESDADAIATLIDIANQRGCRHVGLFPVPQEDP